MKIVSVLRTGPEYGAEHARFLHDQLKGFDSVCLTNLPAIEGISTLPISNSDWHGWWAKMELFNPTSAIGKEDLFYVDVDSKIVGNIRPLMDLVQGRRELVMLSDFYHPQFAASGVMYIPACVKRRIWAHWLERDYWFMVRAHRVGRRGDQGVIAEAMPEALRWDDIAPDQIVSYKKHVVGRKSPHYVTGLSQGNGRIPKGAKIVCYHGNPRPWA